MLTVSFTQISHYVYTLDSILYSRNVWGLAVCLFDSIVYFLLSANWAKIGYKKGGSSVISPHLFKQIAVTMSREGSGDRPEKVKWPAQDWKLTGAKPRSQPKPKPKRSMDICSLCARICCGTARELIAEAFGLRRIQLSPKVSWDGA